jgi:hypothetical protein
VGEVPDPSEAAEPVTVSITIDDHFRVEVVSQDEVATQDPPHSDIDGVEPWALLRGLVESFEVTEQGGATTVSMSWPLV